MKEKGVVENFTFHLEGIAVFLNGFLRKPV